MNGGARGRRARAATDMAAVPAEGGSSWIQEENNLKAVLDQDRKLASAAPYLGREYGVARYERIRGFGFAAADEYYSATKQFWQRVRDRWEAQFTKQGTITLKGPVD